MGVHCFFIWTLRHIQVKINYASKGKRSDKCIKGRAWSTHLGWSQTFTPIDFSHSRRQRMVPHLLSLHPGVETGHRFCCLGCCWLTPIFCSIFQFLVSLKYSVFLGTCWENTQWHWSHWDRRQHAGTHSAENQVSYWVVTLTKWWWRKWKAGMPVILSRGWKHFSGCCLLWESVEWTKFQLWSHSQLDSGCQWLRCGACYVMSFCSLLWSGNQSAIEGTERHDEAKHLKVATGSPGKWSLRVDQGPVSLDQRWSLFGGDFHLILGLFFALLKSYTAVWERMKAGPQSQERLLDTDTLQEF